MAAPAKIIQIAADCSFKIKKLKVRKGQDISKGTLLCLYTIDDNAVQKFKSCHGGTINNIHVKDGQEVETGLVMFTVEGCTHPTVMKDMCASCGMDLRLENSTAGNRKEDVTASVAMVHSIPELIVSEQMAKELGKADQDRLLSSRKLVLLVDLDQTIIHTTMDDIPVNLKGVKHFQLWHGNQMMWHHTKFRPGTLKFLEEISKLFELHICTFGSRMYAHTIAKILDPKGKFFSNRILSRDECFDSNLKTANLKALFPCGDSMVCIIDDREDVWNFVPNMVHVKPYRFFEGTADINAPPGMAKSTEDYKSDTKDNSKESKSDESVNVNNNLTDKQSETDSKDNIDRDAEQVEKSDKLETNEKDNVEINKETQRNEKERTKSSEEVTEDYKSLESGQMQVNNDKTQAKESVNDEHESMDTSVVVDKVHVLDGKSVASSEGVDSAQENSEEKDSCVKDYNKEIGNITVDKDQKVEHVAELCNADKDSTAKEESPEIGDNKNNDDDQTKETESSKEQTPSTESPKEQTPSTESPKDQTLENKTDKDAEEVEWQDEDDYLFFLEDVLKNIHRAFYDMYDQMKEKQPEDVTKASPSLKDIIPYIKKKVLKGCNLVLSGVIPTNMPPEKNRAYLMAVSLGANIQQEIKSSTNEKDPTQHTTHLIAARTGTSKVRTAIKCKHVKIVSVKWLWSCYERWEKVEEMLFLDIPKPKLSDTGRDSPDPSQLAGTKRKIETSDDGNANKKVKIEEDDNTNENQSERTKNKPDSFSASYNPLFAFSDDDIAHMDKEVEDECEDEEGDESSEEEDARIQRLRKQVLTKKRLEEESSSEDSMTGDMPRGWGLKGKLSPKMSSDEEEKKKPKTHEVGPEYESETDQDKFEQIMEVFGPVTSSDDDYQESIGSVDEEMADAVMKEFMS